MAVDRSMLDAYPFDRLASIPSWTMSTASKMPVDAFSLYWYGRVEGCKPDVPYAMDTLPRLLDRFEQAGGGALPNAAFLLDAQRDGIVIVDIEPSCPEDLETRLMGLPYQYAELSSSGIGVHLALDAPNWRQWGEGRTKLQAANRSFELLLSHWVTFTGDVLEPASNPAPTESLDALGAALARQSKPSGMKDGRAASGFDGQAASLDGIPFAGWLVSHTLEKPYQRTPEDFHGDMSRYTYGWLGYHYRQLMKLLRDTDFIRDSGYTYGPAEQAALLMETARWGLRYRDKHDSPRRHGGTWLGMQVASIIEHGA